MTNTAILHPDWSRNPVMVLRTARHSCFEQDSLAAFVDVFSLEKKRVCSALTRMPTRWPISTSSTTRWKAFSSVTSQGLKRRRRCLSCCASSPTCSTSRSQTISSRAPTRVSNLGLLSLKIGMRAQDTRLWTSSKFCLRTISLTVYRL